MKILITGSTGFLGSRTAAYFSSLGYEVQTPVHSQLDITDKNSVNIWFRQHQPHAVIHCAAVSDTGRCQREPEFSTRVNVTGSVNLAAACREFGAKLVFCSSDQVYHASPLPGPHSEREILSPETVYARQKLLAEQQCTEICPDTVSLRLSWMYSETSLPGEHGHLLVSLRNALTDASLPLSWSDRDFRGITDVDAVVKNLPAVLALPGGVYNFGSGNDLDMYHTIRDVFEELNLTDALTRLTCNPNAAPRDIRMDGTLAASHGIVFESTRSSLLHCLKTCL